MFADNALPMVTVLSLVRVLAQALSVRNVSLIQNVQTLFCSFVNLMFVQAVIMIWIVVLQNFVRLERVNALNAI